MILWYTIYNRDKGGLIMAKIAFSKLGLKKKNDIVKVQLIDNIEVDVLQYLPINDKLNLIAAVLNGSVDQNNFANPIKIEVIGAIEIIKAYSNLNFTEKQLEDPAKLFDLLEQNKIIDKIIAAIPTTEYEFLINGIDSTIKAFYEYKNSIYGILDTVGEDYSSLDFDAQKIQQEIGNPENLELLKDVLTKLG